MKDKFQLAKNFTNHWKHFCIAKVPVPVLWDSKKKINVKHYSDREWILKFMEEVLEVFDGMELEQSEAIDEKGRASARKVTNHEIMDVITTGISLLNQRGVKSGGYEWNKLVESINEKNDNRRALVEHND